MRAPLIIGILLVAAGLYVLVRSPSYTEQKTALKLGSLEAKVSEEHTVPPWAGGAAIAVGVVLLAVGARGRKA